MSARDTTALLVIILFLILAITGSKYKYVSLVYFSFLIGFFRRFLPNDSALGNLGFNLDPILLVIPILSVILFVISQFSKFRFSRLEKSFLALICLAFFEIGNPRQGNILVGITGWVAYAVPLFFIFAGRKMSTETFTTTLNSIKIAGVSICFYGLYQVKFGYFSWDQRWFDSVTQSGEYSVVGYGTHRPFATFSSVAEYAQAIGISAGVLTYQYIAKQISKFHFITFSILFLVSSTLTASRGSLILTSVTLLSVFIFIFDRNGTIKINGKWIYPILFFAIFIIPFVIKQIPSKLLGSSSTLVDRQIAGISGNKSEVSSGFIHISQTIDAINYSIKSVYGYGVGAISGAQRFNGQVRINFESDIGNSAYAFGVLGIVIMAIVFFQLYRSIVELKYSGKMCAILILLPSINNWFNPGHYSTVWIIWLLVGSILITGERVQID